MTSRLSSDVLEQLTSVLASLARLVTLGAQPSEKDLQALLLDIGMESKPEILKELQRWHRLLKTLRKQPSESRRRVTAQALMLRGLPEASVAMAVSTVAERSAGATMSDGSLSSAERKIAVRLPVLGDTWNRPVDDMKMVYVPAGEFQMDYNGGDEAPVYTVVVDGFWLDRTLVTNAQYAIFLNAPGTDMEGGTTWIGSYCPVEQIDGQFRPRSGYADHPVTAVSWFGAAAYCEWAGARLPTEAEWEYAARGPEERVYPWGDTFDVSRLNCKEADIEGTTPVGKYPNGASWCGALDMAGNVWEWVADWLGVYPGGRQVNPGGPASGAFPYRVMRGGSWHNDQSRARGHYRNGSIPDVRQHNTGFRCAKDL